MKNSKRILTIGLVLALMASLFCANLSATAENEGTWVEFEEKQMLSLNWGGADIWSENSSNPYACATWKNWGYVYGSQYANIRKLIVPQTGSVSFETIWGAAIYSDDTESFDFAILDKNKKIIWPTDGTPYTVQGAEGTNGGLGRNPSTGVDFEDQVSLTVDVTAGDAFYFVFLNGSSKPTNYTASMIIRNNGNQINAASGYMCASDFTQGGESAYGATWYYMYADSVTLTNANPNGDTDEGEGIYHATYTLDGQMDYTTEQKGGWLTNGTAYGTGSWVQGGTIYPYPGESVIMRFTAPEDGTFSLGYSGFRLSSTSWGNYTDGTRGADIMILNEDGDIIYPETGGPIKLRATSDQATRSAAPSRVYLYNIKKGEYIDFVVKAVNVPGFGYGVRMQGSYYFTPNSTGVRGSITSSYSTLALLHDGTEVQGARNTTMYTSKDLTVTQQIVGEWKDFVQLDSALSAVPATVEAQVKIATNVPDWKTGTLISDMKGTDGSGFAVRMDTFGRPRFISGNVDWTANADLRTGEWERLTFTADTANSKLYCYIDGVLADSTDLAADAALAVSGKTPVIGNDLSYASTTAFQGAMKKLALSAAYRVDASAAFTASESTHYWVLNGVYNDKVGGNNGALTQVGSSWVEMDAPADAADGEYTIVHIGDMQVISDFYVGVHEKVNQWIVDNADRLNIEMVINSGDMVNYAQTKSQWTDAMAGVQLFQDNKLPFILAPGNHEYPSSGTGVPRTAEEFNTNYNISEFFTQGTEENPMNVLYAYPNTEPLTGVEAVTTETLESAVYHKTLATTGEDALVFVLECQPRYDVVDWANTVMEELEDAYPDTPVIVVTHRYLADIGKLLGANDCFDAAERAIDATAQELYDSFISQWKNINLVLCGHVASDVATRVDMGVNGNKIVTIMNDQSYEGNGGEGTIMLYRYKADGTVKAEYYSPLLEKYYKSSSQFDFDTAADSDLAFNLPTVGAMVPCTAYNDRWVVTGSQYGASVGKTLMAAYKNVVAIRSFVPPVSGSMNYKFQITDLGSSGATSNPLLEMALCKGDGTILWPATGGWHTITAKITQSVDVDVQAGEQIHLMVRMKNKDAANSQIYINARSTVTLTDEDGTTTQYISNDTNGLSLTTQGINGWYANYIKTGTNIATVPSTYTVTYGVDGEGGTITGQTGGTWSADALTIPSGGTAYFTTKPGMGYRMVGYYVNGQFIINNFRLVLPMIKENLEVKAVFERIKLEGDANGDGVVDFLDMVHINNGLSDESALIDKTVCDLADADGADIIDAQDVIALRGRILN